MAQGQCHSHSDWHWLGVFFSLIALIHLYLVDKPGIYIDILHNSLTWQVRILYVRNLMLDTPEERLREMFEQAAGTRECIERVKKIKDFAFIHFRTREDALKAMAVMDGKYFF